MCVHRIQIARIESSGVLFERGNGLSVSKNDGKFLDEVSACYRLEILLHIDIVVMLSQSIFGFTLP
jgi:hypothetical protein